MKPFTIVPIVEGHGEVASLPVLLRRLRADAGAPRFLTVNHPLRVKAGQFLKLEEEFRRHVELASAKARQSQPSLVLTLLDCEDDCPATLGPKILKAQQQVAIDVEHLVVLAHREYETWFLAAASSLAGQSNLPDELAPPNDPEKIRGAKEWLGERMKPRGYDEIAHQVELTRTFDFGLAERVPSFRRLRNRIQSYLAQ